MACRFEVTFAEDDSGHLEAARGALDEADRVESLLTVFRQSGELSRVNREAADGPMVADGEVFSLLQRCARLHAETEGAFDVTSTPLSRCWGFLQREARVPSTEQIEEARALVGMDRVELDLRRSSVRFASRGIELNLGAIGKGYAVDRMGGLLRTRGVSHALVSAGGSSVFALGGRRRGWPIDISSSMTRENVARVYLRDGALGTSGAGEQFVIADGSRFGHVIDPRTGWPARGVISATVITSEAADADALSTAFLIGGEELAGRYCESHPGTLVLLAADDRDGGPRTFGAFPGAHVETRR
jgi:thiamine biosynthesis lipoprotein